MTHFETDSPQSLTTRLTITDLVIGARERLVCMDT